MLTLGAPWSLPEAGQRAFPHKRAGIRANTGRPRASDHRAFLRRVDLELPAVVVLAIQSLHRARGVGFVHLDEAEATGTTGVAIGDEREPLDGSMRCEQGTQGGFRRAEGEISDVELGHFRVPTE